MTEKTQNPTHSIDVRQEMCPMTFVRVRLMLDKMPSGDCLEVLFNGEEPARNLPRSAIELGHTILHQDNGSMLLRKA
ncbi:sulfurtransferase TusA family protein [Rhodovarius sp.]|uniref:sulfurtransferase TusA family protein n=1 Tax=Rhodovarius sp. TaxID=2972673 RepID=UPI0034A276E2